MPIDVWGTYVSPDDFEEAAKRGICKKTVESRIASGWKVKDAIIVQVRKRKSEEYKQFESLAVSNGIKASTFRSRVRNGWKLDDAANSPLVSGEERAARSHKTRKRVVPELSVKEARKNGICYKTLYRRLRHGVPMSVAISIPPGGWKHPWKKSNNAIFTKRN